MRVLHFISRLDQDYGGPSRSVPLQIASVIKKGINVDIVTQVTRKPLTEEAIAVRKLGANITMVPLLGLTDMFLPFTAIVRKIEDIASGYDILHVNGIWSPICHVGCRIARKLEKPLVITPHGMLADWALMQKWLKKIIAWYVYQRKDLVSARVIRGTAMSEVEQFRRIGLKMSVAFIPHGISMEPSMRRIVHSKERKALFVSRIHPGKGLLNLVKAVHSLRGMLIAGRWHFTIAGYDEGGQLSNIMRFASGLGVLDMFSFVGPVNGRRKRDLYSSSDLFILPSYGENFGLVIAEALACGVPVITTQATPWWEIKKWRCGWWIPVGTRPLVNALRSAIQLPRRELVNMGRRGRKLIRKRYKWELVGRDFVCLYRWLHLGGKKPACVFEPGESLHE